MDQRATAPLLRQLNTRQILRALQEHGALSRAEIARRSGVSPPTVTRTVSALVAAQLVEEGELLESGLGRPGKVVRLATHGVAVLGFVVGAQHCELVTAGLDGTLQDDSVETFETPARYRDLVKAIVRRATASRGDGLNILGLGVSLPGLLNRRTQRTVFSPNLHQTDGRSLGVDLAHELELPVVTLQESHALCLAEQTYGAARGVADFAMLDISEGLGLGVVMGGRIVEGHSGLAGELGHITVQLDGKPCGCGNRGCLETVATDTAFVAAVSARLRQHLTIDDILAGIAAGTLDATAEIDVTLASVAVAVAAVVNVFNPQRLFVHGRFLDTSPDLFARLLDATRRRSLAPSFADCEIIRARGNKRLGAVAGIIQQLLAGREHERGARSPALG